MSEIVLMRRTPSAELISICAQIEQVDPVRRDALLAALCTGEVRAETETPLVLDPDTLVFIEREGVVWCGLVQQTATGGSIGKGACVAVLMTSVATGEAFTVWTNPGDVIRSVGIGAQDIRWFEYTTLNPCDTQTMFAVVNLNNAVALRGSWAIAFVDREPAGRYAEERGHTVMTLVGSAGKYVVGDVVMQGGVLTCPLTDAFAERLTAAKVPSARSWSHWYDFAKELEHDGRLLRTALADLMDITNGDLRRGGAYEAAVCTMRRTARFGTVYNSTPPKESP